MTLTIQTAKESLAKAREDVQFWENALRILSDPRIATATGETSNAAPARTSSAAPDEGISRPYGELKRRVLATLPDWKLGADCYSTAGIVKRMQDAGFVFASKTPAISVNEALVKLEKEGLATVGTTEKGVRYWIKAAPKNQEPAEAGS